MVKRVSVPYRGATFLNDYADTKYKDGMKVVFVPYRGATFLNEIVPCYENKTRSQKLNLDNKCFQQL